MPTIIGSKLEEYQQKFEDLFSIFLNNIIIHFSCDNDNEGNLIKVHVEKIQEIDYLVGFVLSTDEFYNYLLLHQQNILKNLKKTLNIIFVDDRLEFLIVIKSMLDQYKPTLTYSENILGNQEYEVFRNIGFRDLNTKKSYEKLEFQQLCYKSMHQGNYDLIMRQIRFFAEVYNRAYNELKSEIEKQIKKYDSSSQIQKEDLTKFHLSENEIVNKTDKRIITKASIPHWVYLFKELNKYGVVDKEQNSKISLLFSLFFETPDKSESERYIRKIFNNMSKDDGILKEHSSTIKFWSNILPKMSTDILALNRILENIEIKGQIKSKKSKK